MKSFSCIERDRKRGRRTEKQLLNMHCTNTKQTINCDGCVIRFLACEAYVYVYVCICQAKYASTSKNYAKDKDFEKTLQISYKVLYIHIC